MPTKNGRWKWMPAGILILLKRRMDIVSIKNRSGSVTFYLNKEKNQTYTVKFCDLKPRLCKKIFLAVDCTTFVNISHITDFIRTKARWQVTLTDGSNFTVTEGCKKEFINKKYLIIHFMRLRKLEPAKRIKKMLSSKFDV